MRLHRRAAERGQTITGWLDSRHAFSFGHFYDPRWMGFGVLRVINEDRVAPGAGFATHAHANMEILTWVLAGALAHRDSTGAEGLIRPGQLQRMSAGVGIEHSEFNASGAEPVHFLQIWIQPDRVNSPPGYAQCDVDDAALRGGLHLLAGPEAAGAPVAIRQNARLYAARLKAGEAATFELAAGRRAWLQVAAGTVSVDGLALAAGDALGVVEETGALNIEAGGTAELLLFDLP
jgi:quercetin 2,3-dioxygenase